MYVLCSKLDHCARDLVRPCATSNVLECVCASSKTTEHFYVALSSLSPFFCTGFDYLFTRQY